MVWYVYLCYACLLCPQVVIALGDYMDAQCHACIGGTNVRADIAKLEMGQHIVVGTPGRVYDMIQRKALGMSPVRCSRFEFSFYIAIFPPLPILALSFLPPPPFIELQWKC